MTWAWQRRVAVVVCRPVPAALVLLVLYGCLTLLSNPNGYLGTDTGAKVYTLEVMDRRGSAEPDIGYWAERFDPDGSAHPIYQSRLREDGSWVAVTTLPMLAAARPLYSFGGYRATLLLPMLGSLAAAFASRALARRVGADEGRGWAAFWLIGLASPALVYALDFWEHSVGLACVVGAVALMAAFLEQRRWWQPVASGVLLGGAATLRNEVLVYTLVLTALACVWLLVRRQPLWVPLGTGLLTVGGFAVPWFANAALEQAVDGPSRAARASDTAASGGSRVESRLEDAAQTLLGLNGGSAWAAAFLGGALVLVVLVGMRAEQRGDRRFAMVALTMVGLVYVADAIGGLGFVPGLLLAFPVAIAGLVTGPLERSERYPWAVAVFSLPIVYAFQYVGGAPAQWGGRYTLPSSVLLGVVALTAARSRFPVVLRGLVVLSLLVTAFGAAWVIERTHGVDAFFADVVEHGEPVVIARQAFLIREAGALAVDRTWLSASSESVFAEAVEIARSSGADRFSVLEWDGDAPPAAAVPEDAREVERHQLTFAGTPVGLVTYEFAA